MLRPQHLHHVQHCSGWGLSVTFCLTGLLHDCASLLNPFLSPQIMFSQVTLNVQNKPSLFCFSTMNMDFQVRHFTSWHDIVDYGIMVDLFFFWEQCIVAINLTLLESHFPCKWCCICKEHAFVDEQQSWIWGLHPWKNWQIISANAKHLFFLFFFSSLYWLLL